MGVRRRFIRLLGPDLVNTLKTGPEFYEWIFADAGVKPRDAVAVDDGPRR
jgi:FMN phosphatase YigB (HAD superfamily)